VLFDLRGLSGYDDNRPDDRKPEHLPLISSMAMSASVLSALISLGTGRGWFARLQSLRSASGKVSAEP
jgi:hypothetical protein